MVGRCAVWRAVLCICAVALGTAGAGAQTLTLNEGTNIAAALSPDRTWIAFDLQGTLWVMPAAGGEAKAITQPLMDARQPQWSPDGSKIVFQAFQDGGWHIYTVAPDGSALTQLTHGGFDEREPAWSPDGAWIAFSSDRNGSYDVWVMAADGAEPRMLTTSTWNDHSPTWSPDGKHIAYVSDRESGAGLYAIAFAGVNERLLAKLDGALAGPSWSPDGSAIAFVATTREGSRLMALDPARGTARAVSPATEDAFPFRASWLSATELIYTADAAIRRIDLAAQTITSAVVPFRAPVEIARPTYTRKAYDFVTRGPRPVKGIRGPHVSPDGRRVVFAAMGDLWLADAGRGGRKPQRLTNDRFVDVDPAWSRDGRFIAYVSDRSGKTEIWLRELATGQDRKLTDLDAEVQRPVFSPDGTRIAFFKVVGLAGLGGGALHLLDVASGEVTQLRASIWAPGQMSWSPDGRYLALSALSPASSRFREGWSQFLILAVDGPPAADRFVTPHPDRSLAMRGDDGPIWSPDGRAFIYVFDGRLWRVPVTPEGAIDGAPTRLTDGLADAPSFAADGQTIVYLATDRLMRRDDRGKIRDIHPDFTWTPDLPNQRYVLRAGRVIDGLNDVYAENVDLLIDGNRIAAMSPRRAWGGGVRIVDASDKTVIPGLIESHTHQTALFGERLGRLWLAMGVTSVREPGADPYDALERREAWASGRRLGPRAFFAGGLTDGPRVYYGFANSVATLEHLELEMARAKRLDYDMIKTYVRLPDAMQKIIVEKAHAIGIPVSSHEIYPASSYGVDAVEHLRGTSRRGYSPKQTELGFSYGDVIDILSRTGMSVTPTMTLSGGLTRAALREPALLDHPVYAAIFRPEERAQTAAAAERARPNLAALDRTVAAMQLAVRRIVERGGRVTAGTDSPFVPYGLSFQVELELYQDAGLTPAQVLRAASVWPAERMGLEAHLGTIAPGKLADLVVVDGDPLARIADLRNVAAVVTNGRYITRDELLRPPQRQSNPD